jgi:hypothetical protein
MVLELLKEAIEVYSWKEIAEACGNVAIGTVKRWWEKQQVPKSYEMDLKRLLKKEIQIDALSFKEKDQFFTPPDVVHHVYQVIKDQFGIWNENMTEFKWIEPSAGDGSFYSHFRSKGLDVIAMDIEPRGENIMKQDYLDWTPPENNNSSFIVFGNPPFGLRGHLALRFINHSTFASYICFILPQLFESDGKGVPRKRVEGFHLVHSEKIDAEFYDPSGKLIMIHTVFQIWSKERVNPDLELRSNTSDVVKVYSLSDGGTPGTTRNKKMLDQCHVYLPSTCFGSDAMRCYDSFEELPGRKGYGLVFFSDVEEQVQRCKEVNWCQVAFQSTNSAYNLRTSQIVNTLEK